MLRFLSRKFLIAVGTIVGVVAGIPAEPIEKVIGLIGVAAAYIFGEAYVDGARKR